MMSRLWMWLPALQERFTHARPDLQLLRGFCRDKFGWAADKVDQLLVPVLKVIPSQIAHLTALAYFGLHCCLLRIYYLFSHALRGDYGAFSPKHADY